MPNHSIAWHTDSFQNPGSIHEVDACHVPCWEMLEPELLGKRKAETESTVLYAVSLHLQLRKAVAGVVGF